MLTRSLVCRLALTLLLWSPAMCLATEDGSGSVDLTGELRQWHKVTLTVDGPFSRETDDSPNPFVDYRFEVVFEHESGSPRYVVPGYFAADGEAGESSATEGSRWRAHLCPDLPGKWSYTTRLVRGRHVAVDATAGGEAVVGNGKRGSFQIKPTDKAGRDFRAVGRLEYVGHRYLKFAASGQYFLKAGPDAPETLLAYRDFDGTETQKTPLKSWQPHKSDWREGDPTWKGGKGKGLIGALNYLAESGCNAFSFLTYNAGGDGQNVWPFIASADKLHYDCSKLDQWQVVFDHAQRRGLYLHFKMQEQENDDNFRGKNRDGQSVAAALDGGDLGTERRLYCRELIARFGYALALNWNLGEENTQTPEQQRAMAAYIKRTDPYQHHVVVHTFPNWQERVYRKLLGEQSVLTGASLQNAWDAVHRQTLQWVTAAEEAGRPWVVANDEQGPASHGVPPDPGYADFGGTVKTKNHQYDLHDIRKYTLWGNLMAGGAGVEYYFGYQLPQNDLICEDFRSRHQSWTYCRIALEFFRTQKIPFWEMANANPLVDNRDGNNSRFCFAKQDELYLVYLPTGGATTLDLTAATGPFQVLWFNPREGGLMSRGEVERVQGGQVVSLGSPPTDATEDWLIVVRR